MARESPFPNTSGSARVQRMLPAASIASRSMMVPALLSENRTWIIPPVGSFTLTLLPVPPEGLL